MGKLEAEVDACLAELKTREVGCITSPSNNVGWSLLRLECCGVAAEAAVVRRCE